jgi:hypothetical protein
MPVITKLSSNSFILLSLASLPPDWLPLPMAYPLGEVELTWTLKAMNLFTFLTSHFFLLCDTVCGCPWQRRGLIKHVAGCWLLRNVFVVWIHVVPVDFATTRISNNKQYRSQRIQWHELSLSFSSRFLDILLAINSICWESIDPYFPDLIIALYYHIHHLIIAES